MCKDNKKLGILRFSEYKSKIYFDFVERETRTDDRRDVLMNVSE